jgi:tetrahydromethanopterin S-methyltransferase subunit G
MAKTRHINFKVAEVDFRRIQALKNGQSTTQFFTELIRKTVEGEREEGENFLNLMRKLDSSDLSKIAEKTDVILKKLDKQNGDSNGEIFKKLEQEIGVIRTVVAVIAMGLPAAGKELERHLPAIHKKLKNVLGRE